MFAELAFKDLTDYTLLTDGAAFTFTCLYNGNETPDGVPTWTYQGTSTTDIVPVNFT